MSTRIKIRSKVKNGRLENNRDLLASAIAQHEGKSVEITIERAKNKRTSPQNRWYWGVAVELVKNQLREYGTILSAEDVHVMIKLAVGGIDEELIYSRVVVESTGEILMNMRSSSSYTTTEFMAFKEIIQQWAIETLDLNIPDPDEQQSINFSQKELN